MNPQVSQRGATLPLLGTYPLTLHHSGPRYQPPTMSPATSSNPVIFITGLRESSHSKSFQIIRRIHIHLILRLFARDKQ